MVYQARVRKRIQATQIHRGPDGSAFQKCGSCGISVPIALADMHECEPRKDVKKLKCPPRTTILKKQSPIHQPRSAFRIFMEEFVKTSTNKNEFEVEKEGFETWKNMLLQERVLYFTKADRINSSYLKRLRREENDMPWRVDDEADSADVGKYDENYEGYDDYCDSESSEDWMDLGLRQSLTPVRGREGLFPWRADIKP